MLTSGVGPGDVTHGDCSHMTFRCLPLLSQALYLALSLSLRVRSLKFCVYIIVYYQSSFTAGSGRVKGSPMSPGKERTGSPLRPISARLSISRQEATISSPRRPMSVRIAFRGRTEASSFELTSTSHQRLHVLSDWGSTRALCLCFLKRL